VENDHNICDADFGDHIFIYLYHIDHFQAKEAFGNEE
jgi:hypothetical protein